MTKIVLTEAQYNKLLTYITETQYGKVIKDIVNVGDVIRIEYKNSISNFKVIDNLNGQIQMDNIDSGSANINYRYFITTTSLNGDDLDIRRVHKIKEKDKLGDPKSWKQIEVRDIKKIEVLRNHKVIDVVDEPNPTIKKTISTREKGKQNLPATEEFKTKVDDVVLVFLKKLKEGNGLVLNMINKDVINLCCVSRGGNKFSFTLDSDTIIDELKNWDTFNIEVVGDGESEDEDLYELNKNIINTTDGGESFNLIFKANSGEDSKEVTVKGIEDIMVTPKCVSVEDTEEIGDTVGDDITNQGKVALKMILDDPNLKKAFYSQPTLFNLFIADLKGKNADGKGIVPTLKLLNRYETQKINEKLGNEFKTGKSVSFELVDTPVEIRYLDKNKKVETFKLDVGTIYQIKVRDYKLGDTYKVLYDASESYKILVKYPTEEQNVYMCDIIKLSRVNKKIEQREKTNIRIKFLKSEGYQIKTK